MTSRRPKTTSSSPPNPHRAGECFQNNYVEFEPKSLADVLKWRLAAARDGLPRAPQAPTPHVTPDLAFILANGNAEAAMEPAATWIGHASVLLQMGGSNLLVDPIFSERASPFSFVGPKRHVAPGLALDALPRIDAVLVSHNHYDHLDAPSVEALARQVGGPPLFIVPLGLKAWLADRGIVHAVELDWWQATRVGTLEVVCTPSQHWSSRSLGDRMKTLWGGFAIFAPDFHAFYAGDTAYSKDFRDAHAHFAARHGGTDRGFDLALLPIGAYEPRWFMSPQHVNPAEAVRIHLDILARRSIGIHWGTFQLTDEAIDAPVRDLEAARGAAGLAREAFDVLGFGETRLLPIG
ncbi:MAG: MBL fold metallo-hydrolase [Pseudomonadota bacterium]|nr:MBL fold metallo-hydrolase [Pseudomonadota bacterium]